MRKQWPYEYVRSIRSTRRKRGGCDDDNGSHRIDRSPGLRSPSRLERTVDGDRTTTECPCDSTHWKIQSKKGESTSNH